MYFRFMPNYHQSLCFTINSINKVNPNYRKELSFTPKHWILGTQISHQQNLTTPLGMQGAHRSLVAGRLLRGTLGPSFTGPSVPATDPADAGLPSPSLVFALPDPSSLTPPSTSSHVRRPLPRRRLLPCQSKVAAAGGQEENEGGGELKWTTLQGAN